VESAETGENISGKLRWAGRRDWHIECQQWYEISRETLDIHTGGIRPGIFRITKNEIAQSEGATGKPFARYWLHAEHCLSKARRCPSRRGILYAA